MDGMCCDVCGLDNLTTSCGLPNCGLLSGLPPVDPLADAAAWVTSEATSLYERTGDIKDINTYVISISALKALKRALEDV